MFFKTKKEKIVELLDNCYKFETGYALTIIAIRGSPNYALL